MSSSLASSPVRLASLCSYLWLAWQGASSLTLPWLHHASPPAAATAALAGQLYVVQYLLEAWLASTGVVTMHAWSASEVLRHHLSVGIIFLPACLCCALAIPSEYIAFLESHPPAITVISSACLTGFNEGLFVLRSFLPRTLADTPAVRWAQACCTLGALLQNVPLTQGSCAIGMYRLFLSLWRCASSRRDASCSYSTLISASLFCAYFLGPLFFLLVQIRYIRTNARRVLWMTDFKSRV